MGIQREYDMYWFAFPVVSCVPCTDHCFTRGCIQNPGTMAWDYMRTQSLFQVFCVTQQLFLCLFTERYFPGKKPQCSVLLQSGKER